MEQDKDPIRLSPSRIQQLDRPYSIRFLTDDKQIYTETLHALRHPIPISH